MINELHIIDIQATTYFNNINEYEINTKQIAYLYTDSN